MGNGNGGEGTPLRGVLDFKTVLVVAGVLISVLAGSLYDSWTTRSDDAKRVDLEQWRVLKEIGDRQRDLIQRTDQQRIEINDHEIRLRTIEREHRHKP